MNYEIATAVNPYNGEVLEGYAVRSDGIVYGKRGDPIGAPTGRCASYVRGVRAILEGHSFNVGAVVLASFEGPRPSSHHTVDHIDNNTRNNDISNLRWASRSEQQKNRRDFSASKATAVRNKDTGEIFPSLSAAGRAVSRSAAAIYMNVIGFTNSSAGYHWEYAEPQQMDLF